MKQFLFNPILKGWIFFFLMTGGSIQAQQEKQVDQLFKKWNNPETPGAAVAVVKDGKIVFKKGYGSANLEYNIPISPASVFHIASVSKQFTAYSILILAKEGKLSLDDDIRKYIPEVPDFGKVITLRQLLHHTSGLRDQWNLLAMAGWRLDDVITRDQILRLISMQKELNFDPGDEHLYCNTGYTLLAEVVARVSGQSFAEFTDVHIFKPLKMSNSLFYDDYEKIIKNRAYSFYPDGNGGYKKSVLSYANVGATSLFTTVEDLSLWALNFENPEEGNKDILEKMDEKGVLNNGDTISYAMGQEISRYKGLKYISHGGGDAGYRTFLGRFPDQKFSVIVLSNNAWFDPGGMVLKIADIYLKDKFREEKVREVVKETALENRQIATDTEILKSYCGKYELQPGLIATIGLVENKLYAEAPGFARIFFDQTSPNEFTVNGMNAKVTFPKDDQGQVNQLIVVLNGQETKAQKLKGFDAASVNLSEYTGDFYSPELGTTYTFMLDGGKLIARQMRLGDIGMTPVNEDFFTGNQWFFSEIEFVRNGKNEINGCRVSSGRVRNLWFDKVKR